MIALAPTRWIALALLGGMFFAGPQLRATPRTGAYTSGQLRVVGDETTLPLLETSLQVGNSKVSLFDLSGQPVTAESKSSVVAWGGDAYGEANVPAGLTDVIAVAAGNFFSVALKSDHSLVAWGLNNHGQSAPPGNLRAVIAIAAGAEHAIALQSDGTVVGWGRNDIGQINVPPMLDHVVAITAGAHHTAALRQNRTALGWGNDLQGQSHPVAKLTGVAALAAGAYHTLALKTDGTVMAWGLNDDRQCNVPHSINNIVALAAGNAHSVALDSSGIVTAWGGAYFGTTMIPAGLNNVVAIAAGAYHTLALKRDGSVIAWTAYNQADPYPPASLSGVIEIDAGFYHSLAIVEPPSVFATTPLGTHRDHKLFLTNSGAFILTQLSAVIEGGDADQFSVVTLVPTTITVGAQSPFTIRFAPTRVGTLNATLKIYSNDPDSPFVLPLKGTGNFELAATKFNVTGSNFTYTPLRLDTQTGLMLQKITFTNTTGVALKGLRLVLSKVASGVTVYSSSPGNSPGTLEVLYTNAIAPGASISFDLIYFDPMRRTAESIHPVIKAVALEAPEPSPGPVAGTLIPLRSVRDTGQGPLLEWNSAHGQTYVVEYSSDGGTTWFSAVHRLSAGTRAFWVDRGQPETQSKPVNKAVRMYRVKRL